eukprot:g6414.t1
MNEPNRPNQTPSGWPTQNSAAGRDWEGSINRQSGGLCNKYSTVHCIIIQNPLSTVYCSWRRDGRCSFGDRCKFSHDLRTETDGRLGGGGGGDIEVSEKQLPSTPDDKTTRWISLPDSQRPWRERDGPKEYYKTKLCEKFMSLGRCPYDERCTYAHGYEELRAHPRHPSTTDTADKDPSENQSTTSEKQRLTQLQPDVTPYYQVTDISYLDKVKAICSCVGIGTSGHLKHGAVQEAIADVKSKQMLKGNVYANNVLNFV